VCRDITEEYAIERLRQEMAETREANRSKSELLSRISHELRTPLNGILGFAQLLEGDRKEPLTSIQKQRVQTIRMSGTRLLSLVNDVLELSRIEQQMFSLQRESVSVNSVVNSGIALLQPLALERALQVEFIGAEHELHVKADRRAMDQVFTNLLSNAIKYNRAGGQATVIVEPLGTSKVQISIEDTGVGMSEAQVAARAALYAGSPKATYWQAWAGVALECVPSGCPECFSRCRCALDRREDGVYWTGPGDAHSCGACRGRIGRRMDK
jgi:signal transduction histidine kinase